MIGWSWRKRERTRYRAYRRRVLTPIAAWQLARLSVPSGVATTVVMTGFILFIRIVSLFDQRNVAAGATESIYGAATTIIINVLSLTFFFVPGIRRGHGDAGLAQHGRARSRLRSALRLEQRQARLHVLRGGRRARGDVPDVLIGFFNDSEAVIAAGKSSMQLMGACGPVIAAGMI